MPVLSFRLKLVLAMMLVVAGVSVTTLLITQRRVQATYEKTFRNQFERQINYFTSLQETRLGAVKEQCLKLSQSAPLLDALQQLPMEPEAIYLSASNDLRTILLNVFQENRMTLSARVRASGTFFRFLDAHGKVIEPPARMSAQYLALGYARKIIDAKIARVRGAIEGSEKQQIGYLALAQMTNQVAARPNQMRKAPPPPP